MDEIFLRKRSIHLLINNFLAFFKKAEQKAYGPNLSSLVAVIRLAQNHVVVAVTMVIA